MKTIVCNAIIFVLLFLLPGASYAKEDKDLMKANYYYAHYAYAQAIPHFEKLITEEKAAPALYERLGDCYRLTGNPQKAAEVYQKAIADSTSSNNAHLSYALVLMKLLRYEDATAELNKYTEHNKTDARIANLTRSCTTAAERLKRELPEGVAMFAPFNSDGMEFAPTLRKGALVFTADSAIDVRKSTDKWSGNDYFGIYSIACEKPGEYGTEISKISGPKELNIKYHTGPCTFTASGKEMYFTRTKYNKSFLARKAVSAKDSSVLLEVMIATGYNEKEKKFSEIVPFQHNSETYSVAHPSVSPDGSMLAFTSDMPRGAGGRDLYLCKKAGKDKWTKPVSAGAEVNTEGDEAFPFWADDSTLIFSSDGHVGMGGLDIYKARYNKADGTFSTPENLPLPINSSYDDISLALPEGGSRAGYFSSDRPAEKAGDNIYYYKPARMFLDIRVTDSATGHPLKGAKIAISSAAENMDVLTGGSGEYFARLQPRNERYNMNISYNDYRSKRIVVETIVSTSSKDVDTIVRDIALSKFRILRDTISTVNMAGRPPEYSRQGIMDSIPISVFQLDSVYVIGHFDFNFNKFYYKTNSADINIDKKVVLDTLYNILMRHPTMRIQVQAHSDCRGSDEYNMKLSVERALSVVTYLLSRGIAKSRLAYKGFGETKPVIQCPECLECTEEQHSQNRVLEFRVLQL